jgi:hypothetical protein
VRGKMQASGMLLILGQDIFGFDWFSEYGTGYDCRCSLHASPELGLTRGKTQGYRQMMMAWCFLLQLQCECLLAKFWLIQSIKGQCQISGHANSSFFDQFTASFQQYKQKWFYWQSFALPRQWWQVMTCKVA